MLVEIRKRFRISHRSAELDRVRPDGDPLQFGHTRGGNQGRWLLLPVLAEEQAEIRAALWSIPAGVQRIPDRLAILRERLRRGLRTS